MLRKLPNSRVLFARQPLHLVIQVDDERFKSDEVANKELATGLEIFHYFW